MRYTLSVEAEADVVAIAEQGLSIFGTPQARRYNNEPFDLLDLIADNPRIARESFEIKSPVRIHPSKRT